MPNCPYFHLWICTQRLPRQSITNSEIRNLADWWENEMKATAVNDDSCFDKETIWVWHLMMKLDWSARRNEPKIAPKKKCWIALAKEEVGERESNFEHRMHEVQAVSIRCLDIRHLKVVFQLDFCNSNLSNILHLNVFYFIQKRTSWN